MRTEQSRRKTPVRHAARLCLFYLLDVMDVVDRPQRFDQFVMSFVFFQLLAFDSQTQRIYEQSRIDKCRVHLHIVHAHAELAQRCQKGLQIGTVEKFEVNFKVAATLFHAFFQSLKMNVDPRGSFTELVHTLNCGQVSINISKPGVTKGEHWHNTKWEQFIVVSGHGLIQLRKEGTDEVLNYEVSGDKIQSVIMLPGYTHNIINLSDTEDLVTVMYCNEIFDPNKPDTYFDKVEQK